MLGIIDRFEEDLTVIELEDGSLINIKRSCIPADAKEGYVLNINGEITINRKETARRREAAKEMEEKLWE